MRHVDFRLTRLATVGDGKLDGGFEAARCAGR